MRGFEEIEEGLPPPAGAHIKSWAHVLFVFLVHSPLDVQHDGFIQPMNEWSEGTVCEVYQSFVRLLLFGGGFANIRESSAIGDVPYDSPLCQHVSSAFHAHPRGGWLPSFEPPSWRHHKPSHDIITMSTQEPSHDIITMSTSPALPKKASMVYMVHFFAYK